MYVGAISILFLFVIMITDTGKTPNIPMLSQNNKVSNLYGIAIFVLLLLLFILPSTLSLTGVVSNELDINI